MSGTDFRPWVEKGGGHVGLEPMGAGFGLVGGGVNFDQNPRIRSP